MTLEKTLVEIVNKAKALIDKSINEQKVILEMRKHLTYDYLVSTRAPISDKSFHSLAGCIEQIKKDRGSYDHNNPFKSPSVVTVYVDDMPDVTHEVNEPNLRLVLTRKCLFTNKLAFKVNARDVYVSGGTYVFNEYSKEHKVVETGDDGVRCHFNDVKIINAETVLAFKECDTKPKIYEQHNNIEE